MEQLDQKTLIYNHFDQLEKNQILYKEILHFKSIHI